MHEWHAQGCGWVWGDECTACRLYAPHRTPWPLRWHRQRSAPAARTWQRAPRCRRRWRPRRCCGWWRTQAQVTEGHPKTVGTTRARTGHCRQHQTACQPAKGHIQAATSVDACATARARAWADRPGPTLKHASAPDTTAPPLLRTHLGARRKLRHETGARTEDTMHTQARCAQAWHATAMSDRWVALPQALHNTPRAAANATHHGSCQQPARQLRPGTESCDGRTCADAAGVDHCQQRAASISSHRLASGAAREVCARAMQHAA